MAIGSKADQLHGLRILLEDALAVADDISLELSGQLRVGLADAIDELGFLEAIARAEAAR